MTSKSGSITTRTVSLIFWSFFSTKIISQNSTMSAWGREKFSGPRMSGWNNPGHFQYDSADLPFSGEGGYLESGMPLWKINSITEMEKSFCGPGSTSLAKDQLVSPLVKITSSSSRSQENVSGLGTEVSSLPQPQQQQRSLTADERRRLSQSLPATPLSTPYSTPAQTPYSTPAPTPQSSPTIQRKAEMDAVCKAAARCNQRLVSDQTPQNIKWFYMGFLPQASDTCRSMESSTGQGQSRQLSNCQDSTVSAVPAVKSPAEAMKTTASVSNPSNQTPRPYLRRCAPLMSNRDMNFLAPTSM